MNSGLTIRELREILRLGVDKITDFESIVSYTDLGNYGINRGLIHDCLFLEDLLALNLRGVTTILGRNELNRQISGFDLETRFYSQAATACETMDSKIEEYIVNNRLGNGEVLLNRGKQLELLKEAYELRIKGAEISDERLYTGHSLHQYSFAGRDARLGFEGAEDIGESHHAKVNLVMKSLNAFKNSADLGSGMPYKSKHVAWCRLYQGYNEHTMFQLTGDLKHAEQALSCYESFLLHYGITNEASFLTSHHTEIIKSYNRKKELLKVASPSSI
ncbi:MAG TPA: hypothetical protein VI564_00775 [Candidatus Nanoarchaeia archaeon]|nr:hypothetical protein [Candidatus Nanoarchaeia archaeon]